MGKTCVLAVYSVVVIKSLPHNFCKTLCTRHQHGITKEYWEEEGSTGTGSHGEPISVLTWLFFFPPVSVAIVSVFSRWSQEAAAVSWSFMYYSLEGARHPRSAALCALQPGDIAALCWFLLTRCSVSITCCCKVQWGEKRWLSDSSTSHIVITMYSHSWIFTYCNMYVMSCVCWSRICVGQNFVRRKHSFKMEKL